MKKREKTRYELFVRVRDFGAVNVDTFPASSPGGHAFAVVAEAVDAIMANTTAKRLATTEGRKVKAQKRSAVLRQMQEIARTAKGVAREIPGIDRNVQVPERLAGWKRIRRLDGLPRARSSGVKVDTPSSEAPGPDSFAGGGAAEGVLTR